MTPPRIQVAKPYFPDEDVGAILKDVEVVLRSGMLMQGKFVAAFEEAFAAYVGTRFARAVNSGTSALQATLSYFDVRDREVLIPVNTFLASANAVVFAGGKPVFVDINPDTLALDVEDARRRLTERTKGIMIVHPAGYILPELEELRALCLERGLFLLEDAAHAAGSSRAGARAGSLGDAAAFSLLATKVITAGGEGGMVTTDDEELAKRVVSLRFHGEDFKRGIQDRIGHSWRMTELQAICGLAQVRRLDEIVERRMAVAAAYDRAFASIPSLRPFPTPASDRNGYYKYPLRVLPPLQRTEVQRRLSEEFGVATGTSYWPPCHLQPAYRREFGHREGQFPVAEEVLDQTLALPMHCELTGAEIERVIAGVRAICG